MMQRENRGYHFAPLVEEEEVISAPPRTTGGMASREVLLRRNHLPERGLQGGLPSSGVVSMRTNGPGDYFFRSGGLFGYKSGSAPGGRGGLVVSGGDKGPMFRNVWDSDDDIWRNVSGVGLEGLEKGEGQRQAPLPPASSRPYGQISIGESRSGVPAGLVFQGAGGGGLRGGDLEFRGASGGWGERNSGDVEGVRGPGRGVASLFRGVKENVVTGWWEAHIKEVGSELYIGAFGGEKLAASAQDVCVLKLLGGAAETNFDRGAYSGIMSSLQEMGFEEVVLCMRDVGEQSRQDDALQLLPSHRPLGTVPRQDSLVLNRLHAAQFGAQMDQILPRNSQSQGVFGRGEVLARSYDDTAVTALARAQETKFDIDSYRERQLMDERNSSFFDSGARSPNPPRSLLQSFPPLLPPATAGGGGMSDMPGGMIPGGRGSIVQALGSMTAGRVSRSEALGHMSGGRGSVSGVLGHVPAGGGSMLFPSKLHEGDELGQTMGVGMDSKRRRMEGTMSRGDDTWRSTVRVFGRDMAVAERLNVCRPSPPMPPAPTLRTMTQGDFTTSAPRQPAASPPAGAPSRTRRLFSNRRMRPQRRINIVD